MNIISKVVEVITENSIRFIKILRYGESDVVNTKMISSFGNDFNVPKNYKALYVKTSNKSFEIIVDCFFILFGQFIESTKVYK